LSDTAGRGEVHARREWTPEPTGRVGIAAIAPSSLPPVPWRYSGRQVRIPVVWKVRGPRGLGPEGESLVEVAKAGTATSFARRVRGCGENGLAELAAFLFGHELVAVAPLEIREALLLGGLPWMRGCAGLGGVHSGSYFLWAGSRETAVSAGPLLCPTLTYNCSGLLLPIYCPKML
jgi:hypothetical protein